jgi:glycosyltransferase involved in cell wall biosynthesis
MKICYVGDNAPRLVNLMSDQRDRGHTVHWIALSFPKYEIPNIVIHHDIRLLTLPRTKRALLVPYYFWFFKMKIKEISPDILHSINVRWAGWFSVFSGFKNVIVTPQGGDVMIRPNTKHDSFNKWMRKYTLSKAAAVTYGNGTMLKAISHWATPKKTLRYFAGVNFDLFNHKTSPIKIRRKLDIGRRKVVFSPRMFDTNSNLDILIQTIPMVKKKIPDVLYIFSCHFEINKYSLRMKELIKQLNVDNNCLFTIDIHPQKMPSYYSISDVVISILSSDAMPATLLEAMAMKKLLVISKIPSYMELMNDKFALTVDLRDKEATAKAIIKGLTEDTETAQMKAAAYNWVRKNANIRKLNDELEKLYFDIIKSSSPNLLEKA